MNVPAGRVNPNRAETNGHGCRWLYHVCSKALRLVSGVWRRPAAIPAPRARSAGPPCYPECGRRFWPWSRPDYLHAVRSRACTHGNRSPYQVLAFGPGCCAGTGCEDSTPLAGAVPQALVSRLPVDRLLVYPGHQGFVDDLLPLGWAVIGPIWLRGGQTRARSTIAGVPFSSRK